MSNKGKRSNKKNKGKKSEKDACPCQDKHNDPDWYTREYVPLIGSNWNRLTSLNPENVMGNAASNMNTAIRVQCVVVPPLDASNSAYHKMAKLYSELREMNSGAANYTPAHLAAYVYNIYTMRAMICHQLRMMAAVRAGNNLYRDSPWVFTSVCGIDSYNVAIPNYGDVYNSLAIMLKDMEMLPVPPLAVFDRAEFWFGTVFADSPVTRPAFMCFIPAQVMTYSVDQNGNLVATGPLYQAGTINAITSMIPYIRQIYDLIVNDPINAIIRGDILKAFGVSACRHNLLAKLDAPLALGYNEDVSCQLENATVFGGTSLSSLSNLDTNNPTVVITSNQAACKEIFDATVTSRIINYHGVGKPESGTLLALTRLVNLGTQGSSNVSITNSSGIIPYYIAMITGVSGTSTTATALNTLLNDTKSTLQSTSEAARDKMSHLLTLYRRFPLVMWDASNGDAWRFDLDNYTIVSNTTLAEYTELANRSLMTISLPRDESGRIDRKGMIR